MKRAIVVAGLVLASFVLGWVSVCFRVQTQANERIASAEAGHLAEIARIRQRIYGPNYFHLKGVFPNDDARVKQFNPAGGKGSIAMSFIGGLGHADTHITVQADGGILVVDHGVSRNVFTMDQDRCADFFRRVLTSGILNYSDDVIALKLDLIRPNRSGGVEDAPMTEFRISVPELGIEKEFSICAPRIESEHNPDMIEFQLAAALEQEILSFVPKDDPIWK